MRPSVAWGSSSHVLSPKFSSLLAHQWGRAETSSTFAGLVCEHLLPAPHRFCLSRASSRWSALTQARLFVQFVKRVPERSRLIPRRSEISTNKWGFTQCNCININNSFQLLIWENTVSSSYHSTLYLRKRIECFQLLHCPLKLILMVVAASPKSEIFSCFTRTFIHWTPQLNFWTSEPISSANRPR